MDEVGAEEDGDLFGEAREEEADGQGDEISEGEVEEMAPKRVAPDLGMPSQAEVDEHEVDHTPYRQWCEECVAGRGTGEPHGASKGANEMSVVEFDYLFCINKVVYRREELDEEARAGAIKILVVKDTKSKAIFAHVVPQKGVDAAGYSVARLVEDVKWLGYSKLLLRSDNEAAIVSLLKNAVRQLKTEGIEQVAREAPPSYDSRAQGSVENAVKQVQGLLRSIKLGFEKHIGGPLPESHPVFSWMVEWVAWILTSRTRGSDGRTAFQRVRGRPFGKRLLEIMELCLYKLPVKGPERDAVGKLGARWRRGIFLGFNRMTSEYLLWDEGNVIKARAIQRIKKPLRWPVAAYNSVRHGPNCMYEALEHAPIVGDPEKVKAPSAEGELGRRPQNVQIRHEDWLQHGATTGCAKCFSALEKGWGFYGGSHSKECIERYRAIYSNSAEGRLRLVRAEQRLARRTAREEPETVTEKVAAENPVTPKLRAQAAPEAAVDDDQEEMKCPASDEEYEGLPDMAVESASEDEDMLAHPGPDAEMTSDLSQLWSDIGLLEPGGDCSVEHSILNLVERFGGSKKKYVLKQKQRAGWALSEVYSPPRVTAMAKMLPEFGIIPGLALDLTTVDEQGKAWDFSIPERREEARRRIAREKPMFLVGSPMCTAFCAWQRLNASRRDPGVVRREYNKAMIHLEFVCQLYRDQMEADRYWLHEHPATASSWQERCISMLSNMEGVDKTVGDQCCYGQRDRRGGAAVKKPIGWMSNSPEVLKELSQRCGGKAGECSETGQRHATCSGSVAREAAIYPAELCRAILSGFYRQLQKDGLVGPGTVGMDVTGQSREAKSLALITGVTGALAVPSEEQPAKRPNQEEYIYRDARTGRPLRVELAEVISQKFDDVETVQSQGEIKYWDSVAGQPLVTELVDAARSKELEYFASKNVWYLRPRTEAYQKTGRSPITVKWIDVNKGDDENPNYRSRLVAREIRLPGEDPLFAPTPPLEALRTVLSLAVTDLEGVPRHDRRGDSEMRTQISVIDISRAYFNAVKDPEADPAYVALPKEHPGHSQGLCGLLRVHMYGTRPAADGWHGEYSKFLMSLGFTMGDASACVFRHVKKRLVTSVHGDDFTTSGPKVSVDWMKRQLEGRYELTEVARLGPGPEDDKEVKILNRLVRWTKRGVEYEGDPRQVEQVVADLGLEGAKTVGTPGVKADRAQHEADAPLEKSKHTAYRAVAARCNYVSMDRPEVQFASKELCRWMSQPTELGLAGLKRLGRFFEGHRRLIFEFPFQIARKIETYSDTDWAGCMRSRKSTSGGCLMLGSHLLKSWSSTQGLVSLSSGEAEFYGVTKAAGIGLGFQSLLRDLGIDMPLRVWTDSTATIGICGRRGLGKLRHIDTRSLWLQQKLRDGGVELWKVRGEVNPADVFTKHLSSEERVASLCRLFGCRFAQGRAEGAPSLKRTGVTERLFVAEAVYAVEGRSVEQDGHRYPAAEYEGEWLPDAYLHDDRCLPHQLQGDLSLLFPHAVVPEELEEVAEAEDWLECRAAYERRAEERAEPTEDALAMSC